MQLGAIGFGLEPVERRREQAKFLAHAAWPHLKEGVQTAHDGKVTFNPDRVQLLFECLDEMAPIIDESDLEEPDKLMLHGVISGVLRMRSGGTLSDKRLKIAAATMDVAFEMYSQIAEILELEVDRSGE